jgi:hypothetical protein
MNIKQVNSAIMLGTWTNVELNSMIESIKWSRNQLTKQIKRSIMVGDQVEFTSSKTGQTLQGRVRKVAIKFVTVDTGATVWRVPANMLRVVDKELA